MQPISFTVSGDKESLAEFRKALLAEPQAGQLTIDEPTPQPEDEHRIREPWQIQEAIWLFVVTIPPGIVATGVYEWLRGWLKSRGDAAKVRHKENPTTPA